MQNTTPVRILVVDDETAQMRALCDTLSDHGYQTKGFADPSAALETLHKERFALLLTDLNMPGVGGISLLQAALALDPDLVGVIMTGEGTITSAVEAMKKGAIDYVLKPFKLSVILPVLARALAIRQLRIDNAELERSVRERTLALETANKELEAFSYSVSHDLRSPLTSIQGAATLLVHSDEKVSPELRPLVEMIGRNAERMKALIEDLLRLSRLSHQTLEKSSVDVRALVAEIANGLKLSEEGRNVDVQFGSLPDCVGDPGLLRQVFANLLSNAFKFTRGRSAPQIVVDSERSPKNETIYSVRDNGAGFDMEQAGHLFGAFQRLHSDTAFEGTGVGLSIVRRIVERHDGRIWAEAAPDHGAVFYFSLPDA